MGKKGKKGVREAGLLPSQLEGEQLWSKNDVYILNVRGRVALGDMARVWLGGVGGPEGSGSDSPWRRTSQGPEGIGRRWVSI